MKGLSSFFIDLYKLKSKRLYLSGNSSYLSLNVLKYTVDNKNRIWVGHGSGQNPYRLFNI